MGSSLSVWYGTPETVWPQLLAQHEVKNVFTNHDYEPYARERDQQVADTLNKKGVGFTSFKDQVIFEKDEVCKDDGKPYTVFTPYSRKWKARLNAYYLKSYPVEKYYKAFLQLPLQPIPTLEAMGFTASAMEFPTEQWSPAVIRKYKEQRDFPGIAGTSRLGVHLRFGTISIRQLAREAGGLNETYLNELIWRDFYHMILWHFPHVGRGKSFRPEYDLIQWRNNEEEFRKWCEGVTGYPIVDAGMRELNATGYMHNRVRMIVASFLTKHLLIDWRWGEAYFAQKLLDFDLAANNGGWQWAAGSGCDAAPYFRVFNPYLQTQKFDPDLKYIRHWVPEFQEFTYPKPVVVHEIARQRCLDTYAIALKGKSSGEKG
jgi:deoxyribodipyrimidine photo-lyase